MKKVLFTIVLLLLVQILHAAVSVNVIKTTYDDNFNPTYVIEVKNTDSKTVSNVIVTFSFHRDGSSQWDVLSFKYIERNIKVTVQPNSKQVVTISPNVPDGYSYSGLSLEKVRYTDGSIKSR